MNPCVHCVQARLRYLPAAVYHRARHRLLFPASCNHQRSFADAKIQKKGRPAANRVKGTEFRLGPKILEFFGFFGITNLPKSAFSLLGGTKWRVKKKNPLGGNSFFEKKKKSKKQTFRFNPGGIKIFAHRLFFCFEKK